jgi:hypothetical protein
MAEEDVEIELEVAPQQAVEAIQQKFPGFWEHCEMVNDRRVAIGLRPYADVEIPVLLTFYQKGIQDAWNEAQAKYQAMKRKGQ